MRVMTSMPWYKILNKQEEKLDSDIKTIFLKRENKGWKMHSRFWLFLNVCESFKVRKWPTAIWKRKRNGYNNNRMFEKVRTVKKQQIFSFHPSTTTRGKSTRRTGCYNKWMMYNKKRKGFIIFWSTTRGGRFEWRKWISGKKRKGIEK